MLKEKGKCILIGAGDLTVSEITVQEGDYVIALDGGIGYCDFLQVEPDLIIAAIEAIEKAAPDKILRLKPEKDDTDMLYAMKYALAMGYSEFRIYAGTGGRFDHTLANIQCLLYLKNHDACGYLMDGNGMILVIKNEKISFRENMEGYLSLFSLCERSEGVTIQGFKYELENAVITNDFPIGISNEFIGKQGSISVENGELCCMISYPS